MKINPVAIVVGVMLIGAAVYYLYHHQIKVKVDIKDDRGNKSHMTMKKDPFERPKMEVKRDQVAKSKSEDK